MIVIDDCLSMGYRQGAEHPWTAPRTPPREVIRAGGAQDALTVLTTTPAADPLVRQASVEDPTKLISRMSALHPSDAACNWETSFKAIDDCLSTAAFPQKELVLITDLRRVAWGPHVTDYANRWAAQGIAARIIDVGSTDTADVALTRFIQEDPVALRGSTVRFMASVHNGTAAAITGAEASLTVDGAVRPVMLPTLPAGATTDVPISLSLNDPGQHVLKLSLADDALPGDNVRYLAVNVRANLDMLLIDGRLGTAPFESAGDFLQLAVTAGQEIWHVNHLADSDPQSAHPPIADVAAIVDAASLTPAAIAEYEKRVNAGMGLIIFAGEQVDPQAYNDQLYRNGKGLLPARLERIVDSPARGLIVEGYADSPLADLSKIVPTALAKIQVHRLMAVEVPAKWGPGVRVLAKWNDAEGHPAVIEKQFGKGRVLFFTTSADREWTDWPVEATYVLTVRSAALSIARPDIGEDDVVAGHPLEYQPPAAAAVPVILNAHHDPRRSHAAAAGPGKRAIHYPRTATAGIYSLSWTDAGGNQQQHRLAASFDAAATDLTPLDDSRLTELLGSLRRR